jgi:hypothetical protein
MQLLATLTLQGIAPTTAGSYSSALGSVEAGRPYYVIYVGLDSGGVGNAKIARVFYNSSKLITLCMRLAGGRGGMLSYDMMYVN